MRLSSSWGMAIVVFVIWDAPLVWAAYYLTKRFGSHAVKVRPVHASAQGKPVGRRQHLHALVFSEVSLPSFLSLCDSQ